MLLMKCFKQLNRANRYEPQKSESTSEAALFTSPTLKTHKHPPFQLQTLQPVLCLHLL